MLHVMVQSIHHGPRRAFISMAGLMSAVFICLIASVMGVGAVLKSSPHLFDAIRYAGVAYLLWLGIKSWRATPAHPEEAAIALPRLSARSLYGTGLLTGLSNPKLIIFAAALFPQFLDMTRPLGPQLAILLATFVVIESSWYCAYALGGRAIKSWLAPAARQRAFNRITGTIFIGFGGALLGARA